MGVYVALDQKTGTSKGFGFVKQSTHWMVMVMIISYLGSNGLLLDPTRYVVTCLSSIYFVCYNELMRSISYLQ